MRAANWMNKIRNLNNAKSLVISPAHNALELWLISVDFRYYSDLRICQRIWSSGIDRRLAVSTHGSYRSFRSEFPAKLLPVASQMCAERFHMRPTSSSQVHLRHVYTLIKYLAKKSSRIKHKLCCWECLHVAWDCARCKRNFLLHKSNIVFISLHTNFFFFSFFLHIHFSLSSKKKSSLVAAFLSFFFFPTGTLKHSQNLSTGVSHSSSNCGTVKTIIVRRSSFFYFLQTSSKPFFNLIFLVELSSDCIGHSRAKTNC